MQAILNRRTAPHSLEMQRRAIIFAYSKNENVLTTCWDCFCPSPRDSKGQIPKIGDGCKRFDGAPVFLILLSEQNVDGQFGERKFGRRLVFQKEDVQMQIWKWSRLSLHGAHRLASDRINHHHNIRSVGIGIGDIVEGDAAPRAANDTIVTTEPWL